MSHGKVLWRSASLATLCACLGAGCSLVNSFDEVVLGSAGSAGNAGSAGDGGSGGTGGGGSVGGSAGDGLTGGGMGGDMSDAGSFEAAGPLLVAAGVRRDPFGTLRRVLSVVDADNGEVLDTEQLGVSGVVHDGATDLWYLFLADAYPAPRERPVDMQVRAWENGAWRTVASAPAIPPPQPETFAVLNGRLAYASWKIGPDNVPVQAVTILDTSDPTAITEIPVPADVVQPTDLENPIADLIGTRGRPNDGAAVGGDLVLLLKTACREDICTLGAQPITVGTSISRGVATSLGTFKGRPGITQAHSRETILVAAPSTGAAPGVVLAQFNARNLLPQGTPVTSTSTTEDVSGAAYGDCFAVALFAEGGPPGTTDSSLFGVSMLNALGTREPLSRAGEGLYYEPFTRTLIAPYRGQAFVPDAGADAGDAGGAEPSPAELVAYRVGASAASVSVRRLSAAEWAPPLGLWAQTLAARVPRGFDCPN
jgi:hypothetical protein